MNCEHAAFFLGSTVRQAAWHLQRRFLELYPMVTERWVHAPSMHRHTRASLLCFLSYKLSLWRRRKERWLKRVLDWWPHSTPAACEVTGTKSLVDDLMFRAWGCLIRSEGRKGAREGVVLLADGRIGRSVGLCFRERGAPQEQRRGRVSGWKGGEIIVWLKIITL